MFPFESIAYAQGAGGESNPFISFVPLILIVVVFWFFLIAHSRVFNHGVSVVEIRPLDMELSTVFCKENLSAF